MEYKALVLPAVLAFAGVSVVELIGISNTFLQIGAGIAGAFVGLAIAKHI